MDQLRKEKEEERQLQELQRLQEEQTGKKRQEKLEWMYSTPATGSGPSANDLEDYLLGKKRVDKILTGDENEKVSLLPGPHDIVTNRIKRSVPHTRTLSPRNSQILPEIPLPKSEKILCLPSSNRNRLPTKL